MATIVSYSQTKTRIKKGKQDLFLFVVNIKIQTVCDGVNTRDQAWECGIIDYHDTSKRLSLVQVEIRA